MKIKDTPKVDRPQEKLVKYGTKKLSDAELLAIILRTGTKECNVLDLSKKILRKYREKLSSLEIDELKKIKGLGETKACQLIAVVELARRLIHDNAKPLLISPEVVFESVKEIRESKKEHLLAIYLDVRNREISREIISIGTLTANLVHPREIFEPAIRQLAAGIIIVHNHPSGDTQPSDEDREATKQLRKAGNILGIEVVDHIIVSEHNYSCIGN
ncbi:MAG: DNA repair protein RadC [Patescibacteria group bacterium]|jgi:DNA repair protein RadC